MSSSAHLASSPEALSELLELVVEGDVLVLTGAGVSTESGIPDYRDEQGAWKRQAPMQYRDFVGSEARRQRYWARSMLGWPELRGSRPNPAHLSLAGLEQRGLVPLLVTQNVDGLHQQAGARNVLDLHGRIDRVVCLSCGERSARESLQAALIALNPGWVERAAQIAPDGDAEVPDADVADFRVSPCSACGGVLKPDVVFFGEHVPAERVARALAVLERARLLLVVGSSLMVFSGYRFLRAAAQRNVAIAVVNRGHTRGEELATLKLHGNAAELLPRLEAALQARAADGPK